MEVTLHIPEDIASQWSAGPGAVNRAVLEAFAVERYRQRRLSAFQVRQLFGH